ncbi:hypothetical protein BS1321_02535 [Peribacillus simplex NBRC 15720 = DSM 1321]|uniref:Uncharacterized protein n=1 Tax=Peribacillus simplex NBRC 15720 = DSM 1321 TaxID=1349754 RepID=A0A223ECH4_9BACI|nr:hypothetical protein BS1321_02535 [Peribacillus simplex NBRC 15720 = DSM 1321]
MDIYRLVGPEVEYILRNSESRGFIISIGNAFLERDFQKGDKLAVMLKNHAAYDKGAARAAA